MALDLDPFSHAYTAEEIAHLNMASDSYSLRINRQLFPANYGVPQQVSATESLNDLPGEFVDGHTPYVEPQRIPVHCNGFADAPADVREEMEPLTVEELKAELDAIKLTYEKNATKAALRDKLAVAWAAMT